MWHLGRRVWVDGGGGDTVRRREEGRGTVRCMPCAACAVRCAVCYVVLHANTGVATLLLPLLPSSSRYVVGAICLLGIAIYAQLLYAPRTIFDIIYHRDWPRYYKITVPRSDAAVPRAITARRVSAETGEEEYVQGGQCVCVSSVCPACVCPVRVCMCVCVCMLRVSSNKDTGTLHTGEIRVQYLYSSIGKESLTHTESH